MLRYSTMEISILGQTAFGREKLHHHHQDCAVKIRYGTLNTDLKTHSLHPTSSHPHSSHITPSHSPYTLFSHRDRRHAPTLSPHPLFTPSLLPHHALTLSLNLHSHTSLLTFSSHPHSLSSHTPLHVPHLAQLSLDVQALPLLPRLVELHTVGVRGEGLVLLNFLQLLPPTKSWGSKVKAQRS